MQTVLELGCGEHPGPFFEGVDLHVAVDTDNMSVIEALRVHPDIRTEVMDATALDFPDESIDVVLARNVFGDPLLGISEHSRNMATMLMNTYALEGQVPAFLELTQGIGSAVDQFKVRIINEVKRVLVANGKLVIVEQSTPVIAEQFIETTRTQIAPLEIKPANIFDITPRSYAEYHTMLSSLVAWQAIKNS